MAWGSQSFATFLILCPPTRGVPPTATSFFLGILFSLFPYDYPLLWTTPPSPLTTPTATPSPFDLYETHLTLLANSPPLIPRILHIVISVGLLGFFAKLYKPSESNLLFDGASLVLYVCAIVVYVTNTVASIRAVGEGLGDDGRGGRGVAEQVVGTEGQGELVDVGREEGLRVLAASNTILALVLLGVLVLQAGQWYAERKEGQEVERLRREEEEKRGKARGVGGKKKV